MQLQGMGIGRGMAVGPVLRMPDPLPEPADVARAAGAASEFAGVDAALSAVAAELTDRGSRAGGDARDMLEAAAQMARDPTLIDDIRARIDTGRTGQRAVFEAVGAFTAEWTAAGGLLAERVADLDDIARRVIAHLRGVPLPGIPVSDTPFVLVAADLAPADTALLDLTMVLALVTSGGGPTSHTAILARQKSIPAIVAVAGALDLADGTVVIVDAASGSVTTSPTDTEIRAVHERARSVPVPITDGALKDGTKIPLLANLGSPDEAMSAIELGAEGVGLFRTEFLFLGSAAAPTVDDQRARYTELLARFPGRKVVVRVLDAGADKPLAFLGGEHEDNPALGLRGLRALRANESVLREQLTALAQADAATDAELWVMAPMVSDAEETDYFVTFARELGLRTVGVMAEVPSLALVADRVFESADFVSVGTNDLTQYTLAADRTLGSVARYQDPWHPAVLRLIKLVGDAGRASGRPVGICGEAAADPQLAVVLVGLGATSLSMAPAALADVRAELALHSLAEAQALAERAVTAGSAAEARAVATLR
ncbi:MAG: ptsA [Microbacteriaceae bacterium]|nr:ptsA [Microbacteriaceae bacterium]